ncbi:MAG: cytochrome ubiquinol oxidase subunit I [Candidatus Methylomirabilales bacterium]
MPDLAFPIIGNRTAIWIVAQLHLNFAAFILGAPIFIVISEYLGWRKNDPRYERLAREMTKITAVAYSLTALLGGFFALMLSGLYPEFSGFLFPRFFMLWVLLYPVFFILETLSLYTYWYSWDALKDRKGLHIAIGVGLNIIGALTMLNQNAIASFMNTPPETWQTASLWQLMNNPTWWPLNLHRFIANVVFGGFITGLVAAYMYLTSKDPGERAFYDWMGFSGNLIGTATFVLLMVPGYIYGREIYAYDASLGIYLMSDRLSMFFEMQGILVGLLFLAANYYMWLSVRRIEGGDRFALPMKIGFALIFLGNAIWATPRHFFATMILESGMLPPGMTEEALIAQMELPAHLGFLALMPAKNAAAAWTALVTLANYVFYRIAIRRGRITWGRIETPSQYALIVLAFAAIWTMGLMGAVRSLMRKSFHVYNAIPDFTAEPFTPTLFYSTLVVTAISLIFFLLITFIIWLSHKLGKPEQEVLPGEVGR